MKAQFSSDGTQVIVALNEKTNGNILTFFPCNTVIAFVSADFLSCMWYNDSQIRVLDVNTALSVKIGSNVSLRANNGGSLSALEGDSLLTTIIDTTPVALEAASMPQLPVIGSRLSTPYLPFCSSWVLDLTSLSGNLGRAWQFLSFSVQGLLVNDAENLQRIQQEFFRQYSLDQAYVTIANSFLIKGEQYNVSIEVCNFVGGCERRYLLTQFSNDTSTPNVPPIVNLLVGSSRSTGNLPPGLLSELNTALLRKVMYANDSLTVLSDAYTPICVGQGRSTSSLRFAWKLQIKRTNGTTVTLPLQSRSKDARKFVLSPYSLDIGKVYLLQLTVTDSSTGLVKVSDQVMIVVMLAQEVVASISPAHSPLLLQLSRQPLVLDAAYSFDPNYGLNSANREGLVYNWSCITVSCPLRLDNIDGKARKIGVTVQGNAAINTTSKVFLQVYAFYNSSIRYYGSAFVEIYVTGVPQPVISLQTQPSAISYVSIDRDIIIEGSILAPYACNATWTSNDPSLSFNKTAVLQDVLTSTNLFLPAYLLQGSRDYEFVLRCNTLGVSNRSIAGITVTTNRPPVGGKLSVQPMEGFSLNTTFQFVTSLWQDEDLPIVYGFFFLPADDDILQLYLPLSPRSEMTIASGYLPVGSSSEGGVVEVSVVAEDAYKASSDRASAGVLVYPLQASTRGDVLNAVTDLLSTPSIDVNVTLDSLQNVVSVSTSVMNLANCSLAPNCSALHRQSCGVGPAHVCGSCLPSYIASIPLSDNGNSMCYLASRIQSYLASEVIRTCSLNSQCFDWQVCQAGKCVDHLKSCVSPSCSNHGTCVFIRVSDSAVISSAVAGLCTLFNSSCTAQCICHDGGFGGRDCSSVQDTQTEQATRLRLLDGLETVWTGIDLDRIALAAASSSFATTISSDEHVTVTSSEKVSSLTDYLLTVAMNIVNASSPTAATAAILARDITNVMLPVDSSLSSLLIAENTTIDDNMVSLLGSLTSNVQAYQALVAENKESSNLVLNSFRLASQNAVNLLDSTPLVLQAPLSAEEETLHYFNVTTALPSLSVSPDGANAFASMAVFSAGTWKNDTAAKVDSRVVTVSVINALYVDVVLHPSNTTLLQSALYFIHRQYESNGYGSSNNYTIACNATEELVKSFICPGSNLEITRVCNRTAGFYTGFCPYLGFTCSLLDLQKQQLVQNDSMQYCMLLDADEASITCRCVLSSSSSSRRRLQEASQKDVKDAATVALVVQYVQSDLSTTFNAAGDFNDASSIGKVYIIIVLYGSLWMSAIVCMIYVSNKKYGKKVDEDYKRKRKLVNKRIEQEAMEHNRQMMKMIEGQNGNNKTTIEEVGKNDAGAGQKQSLLSIEAKDARKKLVAYVASVFPAVFETPSLTIGIKNEFSKHHLYFNFFFNLLNDRTPLLTIINMMTIQSFMLFMLALLYDLNYPDDDGTCRQYSDEVGCLQRKYILDDSKSYCEWSEAGFLVNGSTIHCRYANPTFSFIVAMYVAMFIAVATCFLVEPLDYIMVLLGSPTAEPTSYIGHSNKPVAQTAHDMSDNSPVIPTSSTKSTSSSSSKQLDLPDTAGRYHSSVVLEAYDEAASYASEINSTVQPLLLKRESRRLQLKQQLSSRLSIEMQPRNALGLANSMPQAPRTFRLLKQEMLVQRSLLVGDDLDEFDDAWGIDRNTNDFIDLSRLTRLAFRRRNKEDSDSSDDDVQTPARDRVDVESIVKKEVGLAEKISEHVMVYLPQATDVDRGFEILQLFVRDLLGRDTPAARIFANKAEMDFERMQTTSVYVKVLLYAFVFALNAFCIYYTMLKGFLKGLGWQYDFVKAFIAQLLMDVLLFETLQCLWIHVAVPYLVAGEVQRVYYLLKDTIDHLYEDSYYADENIVLNAPEFLFVSSRVAAHYPHLVESTIVRAYMSHLPGAVGQSWQKKIEKFYEQAGSGKRSSVQPEDNDDDDNERGVGRQQRSSQPGMFSRCYRGLRRHVLWLLPSAYLVALLVQIAAYAPLQVQRLVLRTLEPVLLSGLTLAVLYVLARPIYLGALGAFVGLVLIYVVYDYRRTRRKIGGKRRDRGRAGKVSKIANHPAANQQPTAGPQQQVLLQSTGDVPAAFAPSPYVPSNRSHNRQNAPSDGRERRAGEDRNTGESSGAAARHEEAGANRVSREREQGKEGARGGNSKLNRKDRDRDGSRDRDRSSDHDGGASKQHNEKEKDRGERRGKGGRDTVSDRDLDLAVKKDTVRVDDRSGERAQERSRDRGRVSDTHWDGGDRDKRKDLSADKFGSVPAGRREEGVDRYRDDGKSRQKKFEEKREDAVRSAALASVQSVGKVSSDSSDGSYDSDVSVPSLLCSEEGSIDDRDRDSRGGKAKQPSRPAADGGDSGAGSWRKKEYGSSVSSESGSDSDDDDHVVYIRRKS